MADINVKAVLETNTTLNGTFTTPDGVPLLNDDLVLVAAQASATQNGVWQVKSGLDWVQQIEGIDYRKGFEVRVLEGTNNELTLWIQTNDGVPGTSSTTYRKESLGRPYGGVGAIQVNGAQISLADSGVVSGAYELASINVGSDGRILDVSGSSISSTFMEGLGFEYINATQVQLKAGSAYIPGLNRTIRVGSPITSNVVSGAYALSYLYLYETNGVGQFEISNVAPDTPYQGHARYKTGDETRRFIGMIKNDVAGNLIPFNCEVLAGNIYRLTYGLEPVNQRVVNAFTGNTSVQTEIIGPSAVTAANRLVGPSAMSAFIYWTTVGAGVKYIGYNPAGGNPPRTINGAEQDQDWIDLGNNHELRYKLASAADSISLYVQGFMGRR